MIDRGGKSRKRIYAKTSIFYTRRTQINWWLKESLKIKNSNFKVIHIKSGNSNLSNYANIKIEADNIFVVKKSKLVDLGYRNSWSISWVIEIRLVILLVNYLNYFKNKINKIPVKYFRYGPSLHYTQFLSLNYYRKNT